MAKKLTELNKPKRKYIATRIQFFDDPVQSTKK